MMTNPKICYRKKGEGPRAEAQHFPRHEVAQSAAICNNDCQIQPLIAHGVCDRPKWT